MAKEASNIIFNDLLCSLCKISHRGTYCKGIQEIQAWGGRPEIQEVQATNGTPQETPVVPNKTFDDVVCSFGKVRHGDACCLGVSEAQPW